MDTTPKTWEEHVRAATAYTRNRRGAGRLRAQLAHRLERAHECAVADAKRLAESAACLVRRLETEGLAATTGGIAFVSEAQTARESILALEHAREALRSLLCAYESESGKEG